MVIGPGLAAACVLLTVTSVLILYWGECYITGFILQSRTEGRGGGGGRGKRGRGEKGRRERRREFLTAWEGRRNDFKGEMSA